MKLALKELFSMEQSVSRVMSKELPYKLSYRLGKIVAKLQTEFRHINKTKEDIIKKYGTKDDKSGRYTVSKDNFEAFSDEFEKFLEEIIEFDCEKIPQDCCETLSISPNDVALMLPILEEVK